MKNCVITLDTGTTNTRAILWQDAVPTGAASRETGVGDTAADGSNARLKQAVGACIREVLSGSGLEEGQVRAVLASGMITSNVGLWEVPHCAAPAGAEDLAAAAKRVCLPEICSIPFLFIPGVKNPVSPVDLDTFPSMDMMRGEEVETLALLEAYPKNTPYLLILPGSHMKFVAVDAAGKIRACLTSISGELLSAVTRHTIVADAVGRRFVREEDYDAGFVALGWREAGRAGLGRACFSARILSQFPHTPPEKLACYLLGAVLQSDLTALRSASWLDTGPDTQAVVAGKGPLRRAMAQLLEAEKLFRHVHVYEGSDTAPLSALGARKVGALLGVC